MSKRKLDATLFEEENKHVDVAGKYDGKKHSLDSDEEDSGEEEEKTNVMHADDIEGEEDGNVGMEGEVGVMFINEYLMLN